MKKILFVLSVFVLFGLGANAQNVRYGVKAGINYTNVKVKDADKDPDAIFAMNVGVFAQYDLTNKFSIQPELLFTQGGGKAEDKVYLNYVALPIMGKYKMTNALSLEFGPQIGYLVSAKSDGNDISKAFKDFSFGLNLGLDYQITKNIMVDVRYNLGLNNVCSISGADIKNRMFQLSVGYIF